MDETLVIRRFDLAPARRPTTQFAPERRAAVWPWFVAVALLAIGAAQPMNPMRDAERSTHAQQILTTISR